MIKLQIFVAVSIFLICGSFAKSVQGQHIVRLVGSCVSPTPAQILAERDAGRNPLGLLYQFSECVRSRINLSGYLDSVRRRCVQGTGAGSRISVECVREVTVSAAESAREATAHVLLQMDAAHREAARAACPGMFGNQIQNQNFREGAHCLYHRPDFQSAEPRGASELWLRRSQMEVALSLCASNGRGEPVLRLPADLPFPASPPPLTASASDMQAWSTGFRTWQDRVTAFHQTWVTEQAAIPAPGTARCNSATFAGIADVTEASLRQLDHGARVAAPSAPSGPGAMPVGGGGPALSHPSTGSVAVGGAASVAPVHAQAGGSDHQRTFVQRLISGDLNPRLECAQQTVSAGGVACERPDAAVLTSNHTAVAATAVVDSVQKQRIRGLAAKFSLMRQTEAYLGLLARQLGQTPEAYHTAVTALIAGCRPGSSNQDLLDSLRGLGTASDASFAANSHRPETSAAVGTPPRKLRRGF